MLQTTSRCSFLCFRSTRSISNMKKLILTALMTLSVAIGLAKADPCHPNPCKNGGACQPPDKGYNWGYFCTCQPGYIGAQCQWDSNECNPDTTTPCLNNGICTVLQDGRFCICPGDTGITIKYGGHYCEIEDPCSSCPSNTIYCNTAPTVTSGRLCLNATHQQIDPE